MDLALYSPEDITIMLGGIYEIVGLQEGTFLSISKDEAHFKTFVSTDGKVTRIYNNHPIYTVKMTLSCVADVNNVLTSLSTLDKTTYGVTIPLFIKDGNGTSLFYASSCWIEKIPDVTFSEGVESREWVIKASDATNVVGGNGIGGVVSTDLAAVGMIAADFVGLI